MTAHSHTRLRGIILFTAIFGWVGAGAVPAANIGLDEYAISDDVIQIGDGEVPDPVTENLSGVTFSSNTGSLFTVINSIGGSNLNTAVVELATDGTVQRSISLTGFEDTEGIVHLGGDRFGIIEERRRNLVTISIGAAITTLDRSVGTVIPLGGGVTAGSTNQRLEGITYNSAADQIYVVREQSPQEIRSFDLSDAEALAAIGGAGLESAIAGIMSDPFDAGNLNSLALGDLAGLHFNTATNSLLILSEQSDRLVEVSPAGALLSSISLTGENQLNQPEGVTMGSDGTIYIVGEPDELAVFVGPEPSVPEPSVALLALLAWLGALKRRRP